MNKITLTLFLVIAFLTRHECMATHLRAADIIVQKVDCSSLRYRVILRVYVNTLSQTPVGGGTLEDGHISFGDGRVFLVPQTMAVMRPDLGENMAIATIEIEHTYGAEGVYKINYFERDRSGGVVNISGSHDVAYSTFVLVNAVAASCNSFPTLNVPPIDRGCRGVTFFHSAGATDADGDSLSYTLVTPFKSSTETVDGFLQPNDARFYTNFSTGNEAGNAPPTFEIDPVTGLLRWDAPGMQGEYNIAFKVTEWRRNPDTGLFLIMSETIRDMQIVVEDCANRRPLLNVPQNLCVEAGTLINVSIAGQDPENHPIKIEVFGSIFDGGPETFPASYSPVMTDFQASPSHIDFQWQTNCVHVRDQAYQIVFKITDSPPSGPKLVTFETWNIRVIAPKPVWVSVIPDLVNRTSTLQWQPYSCTNAEKIEIWRKTGSVNYTPGVCEAGLSRYKGYDLIAEVDPATTMFRDDNNGRKLAAGAVYCYRLVAAFALPAGGKSYVSLEYCMDPILADAPVITHVSVKETSKTMGSVLIKWLPPFDISQIQYPPPYEYEIFRGTGFSSEDDLINISGRLPESSGFEYQDESLNTFDEIYNYRIVVYSRTQNNELYHPIDTSAFASTVRLSAEPGEKQIKLTWEADVPWSNVVDTNPWHRIYRGGFGDKDHELILIDSVDVTQNGFEYIDEGKFQNTPLEDDVMYSYAIQTRGTYGNIRIPIQLNRSQMVSLYPINTLPPCIPELIVDQNDCGNLKAVDCFADEFSNTLRWQINGHSGCRKDIVSFNLYVSGGQEEEFVLLQENLTDQTFIHEGLDSYARCYRVVAVDTQGNVSEQSETACNDNCFNFSLPNVFTPNGDGCNDVFSVFNGADNVENPACPPSQPGACPNTVKAIKLKVMSRWGRLLYEYKSDANNTVLINWNGRDKNGNLLESGVYYYVADVNFESVDPSNRNKTYKGWVNLLR